MNNPFEGKAIKFATEQELQHLAELARGYELDVDDLDFEDEECRYFRINLRDCYRNCANSLNQLPEITYSDFIASLESTEKVMSLNETLMSELIKLNHTEQPDMVNHPPHYTVNGIEVIDVIENYKLNYRLGNVVKYVLRSDLKGNRLQDLKKALWYLQREIDKTEKI
jgi:hypothetical protein